MRRILLIAGGVLAILLLIGAVSLFCAYSATQVTPEFYEQALKADPPLQEEKGDELERRVLDLQHDAKRFDRWWATFSEEQVNGWLAADLPKIEQLRRTLESANIEDPRVHIQPDEAHVACRYNSPKFQTVLSLTVDVTLSDEPNVVAVRLQGAQAGMLPLPMSQLIEHATAVAKRENIDMRWSQIDGDPVALIRLPSRYDEMKGKRVVLEGIELKKGELALTGRTEEEETPGGPALQSPASTAEAGGAERR